MSWFERFILFLQSDMETPTRFGWFHIGWLILTFVFIIFLAIRVKKYSDKQLKLVIGTYGIIAFIFELLKQISWAFTYDAATKVVTWNYEWYAAPFQLCTTPIYVCLICLFLKKCKLRDSLLSFIAYVTILGSISTMILPDSCFVSDILVNIHTMWLHMGSFVVSVYLLMSGAVKISLDSWKKAVSVFILLVGFALGLNIGIYNSGILNGETFNMFYISPYFISILPVFNIIQENVPYVLFLSSYVIALSLGSLVIYLLSRLIKFCIGKK